MIVLGIDIGLTGAIAAIDHVSAAVEDMPTQPLPGDRQVKREVDPRALMLLVRQLVRPGVEALAVMEDVHAGVGMGTTGPASLMDSKGCIRAVLSIARIDVRTVQPRVWKRAYGLTSDKGGSLVEARRMFPLLSDALKRKRDHNRAEALLIAAYARQRML